MNSQEKRIYSWLLAAISLSSITAASAMSPNKDLIKASINQKRLDAAGKIPGFVQSLTAPPGFPLPIYGSRQTALSFCSATNPKTPSMAGSIITMDPPDLPYKWYKQLVSSGGWKIRDLPQSKKEKAGEFRVISASKGTAELMVTFVKSSRGSGTMINISTYNIPKTKSRYKL